MRDAARVLDDVSDHLGEVLHRADELLVEWSRFGAQVRTQVEREAAAIGEVVEGAVGRAAGAGIDRAIADRLRALTAELERLEQRTRAAQRVVVEHRESDRRMLWIVVAGIALANMLLVALLLREPSQVHVPVAEPLRVEAPVVPAPQVIPPASPAPAEIAVPSAAAAAQGSGAVAAPSTGSAGQVDPGAGSSAGSEAAPAEAPSNAGSAAGPAPATGARPGGAATKPATSSRPAGAGSSRASPVALPPRGGARVHKKQP